MQRSCGRREHGEALESSPVDLEHKRRGQRDRQNKLREGDLAKVTKYTGFKCSNLTEEENLEYPGE